MTKVPLLVLSLSLALAGCGDSAQEEAVEARTEAAEELLEGDTADAREELQEAQQLEAGTPP